ncbi:uncharacterized protein STEHIDRAFT_155350 [Stereum hirsutum FP-91666 SS1]|uniref:uncharacterized protein n=1 Tax=Stereum hirsutum (strain FP-91666) TaxID=721885 RepID=UPI000440BB95|nr:uncharacterized protein STEHIDRAFT_155350 [Stereum hirsutum FP-91666 SS1]EIM87991.1 hypothetical protein STEHIDRAFT_155350 [Stereum hirsutum FP-91666 SS1]
MSPKSAHAPLSVTIGNEKFLPESSVFPVSTPERLRDVVFIDEHHVRPGLTMNQHEFAAAKEAVLDLLGWGVPSEYLVDCGLSRQLLYYVFTELNLHLPTNLDLTGIISYPPPHGLVIASPVPPSQQSSDSGEASDLHGRINVPSPLVSGTASPTTSTPSPLPRFSTKSDSLPLEDGEVADIPGLAYSSIYAHSLSSGTASNSWGSCVEPLSGDSHLSTLSDSSPPVECGSSISNCNSADSAAVSASRIDNALCSQQRTPRPVAADFFELYSQTMSSTGHTQYKTHTRTNTDHCEPAPLRRRFMVDTNVHRGHGDPMAEMGSEMKSWKVKGPSGTVTARYYSSAMFLLLAFFGLCSIGWLSFFHRFIHIYQTLNLIHSFYILRLSNTMDSYLPLPGHGASRHVGTVLASS